MKHVAVVHSKCDKPHCVICDGGLFVCAVCGCAEGATTDDCPGVSVTGYVLEEVYAGRLNFRDGMWRHEHSSLRVMVR